MVKSEVDLPSDEDVLRKVAKDLSASGLKVSEGVVRGKMDEFLAIARDELKSA
ncbi:MAG TPA: ATPase inhibitor subunit zeta [Caulobacteraceae bacterium]|nr:ATPase inhibitor subunit zeta [Caulobacteraceae bacterium]